MPSRLHFTAGAKGGSGKSTSVRFVDYEDTAEALEFHKHARPYHVTISRLDEEYQTELERFDLTITEVLDSSNGTSSRGKSLGPVLSQLMVRARLRKFQRLIY